MNEPADFAVDFVARGDGDSTWALVLVEEGPWHAPYERELGRVQDRLYNCIDAAIDGEVAAKFPESQGKRITIRLDCYNLPRVEVEAFFERFAGGALETADYRRALEGTRHVAGISFEVRFGSTH